jgi:energy-coupling factor transporter ATP-binding protein EcfA2
LRPFQTDDSEYFFGRDAQVDDVVARLRDKRFVAVIGGSGSGKSSLVLAGAIPRLRTYAIKEAGDFWVPVIATPGTNHVEGDSPLRRLALKFCSELVETTNPSKRLEDCVALLRSPDGLGELVERFGGQIKSAGGVNLNLVKVNFLFLVDQFEELFHPSNERNPFAADCKHLVDRIVEQFKKQHPQVCVALTMRSEHLNDCPRYDELPDAINAASYLVKRLNQEQLRNAIEQPVLRYHENYLGKQRNARRQARREGQAEVNVPPIDTFIVIEENLIERLLEDSKAVLGEQGHADQLPLLQHALFWIWHEANARCKDQMMVDALTLVDLWAAVGPSQDSQSRSPESRINTLVDCLENRCSAIYTEHVNEQKAWQEVFRSLAFKEPNTGTYTQQRASMAELRQRLDIITGDNVELAGHLKLWMEPHGYLYLDEESGTVKVAHETLIRRWKRFRDWIDDEDRQFHLYLRLLEDCERWKAAQATGGGGLSGGDTLRRYESEHLLAILKDPVRVARFHRLLGLGRDSRRPSVDTQAKNPLNATNDAINFLELSIKNRSDRDQERKNAEEQKRLVAETLIKAQVQWAEAQAVASEERAKVAQAREEVAVEQFKRAVADRERVIALGEVQAERAKVLRNKVRSWLLLAGFALVAVFFFSERMLASQEYTLHRGYALAAETSAKFEPQFLDFDGAKLPLLHALQGAYFFQIGSAQYTGPAAVLPLRWFYLPRIDGLLSTQLLGEARNIASLRTVLRGAAWPLSLHEKTTSSLNPAPPSDCNSVWVGNTDRSDSFAGAKFYAGPSMADRRGLVVTAPGVQGAALYVGRLNVADKHRCEIENQLSSPPVEALRVGIAADLSNLVFEFYGYFQLYTITWGNSLGVGIRPRVVIKKLGTESLGPGGEFVQILPSAYAAFATDIQIANRMLRVFDMEPTPISESDAMKGEKGEELHKTPEDVDTTSDDIVCAAFAKAKALNLSDNQDNVWSVNASGDHRTYCLHVKPSQASFTKSGNLFLASLYAFQGKEQASDSTKHLPLLLEEVVGTVRPTKFNIDAKNGWLAFKGEGGEWRALPWGLSAWGGLAKEVFAVPAEAPTTWFDRALRTLRGLATVVFTKNIDSYAAQDEQPFNLLLNGTATDDVELSKLFSAAAGLPLKVGSAMGVHAAAVQAVPGFVAAGSSSNKPRTSSAPSR